MNEIGGVLAKKNSPKKVNLWGNDFVSKEIRDKRVGTHVFRIGERRTGFGRGQLEIHFIRPLKNRR